VGDAHIENLGNTRQGILQAKCEIFENLTPEGVAVLNGDDELLNTVTLPQIILRCGEGEHCDVRVTDIDDRGLEGMACTVTTGRAAYRLETAAPGRSIATMTRMPRNSRKQGLGTWSIPWPWRQPSASGWA
jgi:UDP-N-acetylmuramoyl-tripeptide--D-alanyl-D-alanine ligase